MQQRQPHETKSGQPICPDCLDDWNKCFPDPLTTVNNLPGEVHP